MPVPGTSGFLIRSPCAQTLLLRGSAFSTIGRTVTMRLAGSKQWTQSLLGLRAGATNLSFRDTRDQKIACPATIIVAKKQVLEQIVKDASTADVLFGFRTDVSVTAAMLQSVDGSGSASSFFPGDGGKTHRLTMSILPEKTSRNNHPMSVHKITDLLLAAVPSKGNVHIIIAGVSKDTPAAPLAAAVSRAFPLLSMKTAKKDDSPRHVRVTFVDAFGSAIQDPAVHLAAAEAVSEGVRLACRLVDMPPDQLTTDSFAAEARSVAAALDGVTVTEIAGDELRDKVSITRER
jgi:leucyl aminopeptidase